MYYTRRERRVKLQGIKLEHGEILLQFERCSVMVVKAIRMDNERLIPDLNLN